MDKNDALKSLIEAASQHASSQTENNLMELQRSLDVLIGLTTTADLDLNPHSLLITESFSVLLSILLNAEIKPGLAQRVITLLQNFSRDAVLLEIMQSPFNVHSIISMFLLNNVDKEVLFLPCLSLLNTVTYNIQIAQVDGNLENLIKLLIDNIGKTSDNVETVCLSILNHICQKNPSVQSFIRNMSTAKQTYKILIGKLSHPCRYNVINALSTLASLVLDSDIGDKLFSAKNISKTFQLIFNLSVSEDSLAKRAAIDLLLELLSSSMMLDNFMKYKYLLPSLQKVLDTLAKDNSSENSSVVLKLMLGFACIPTMTSQICSLICPTGEKKEACFVPNLIYWIDKSVIKSDAPILAIKLLNKLLEEYISKGYLDSLRMKEEDFNCIIQEIYNMSKSETTLLKREYEKIISLFDLLITVCREKTYEKQLVNLIDIVSIKSLVMKQLSTISLYLVEDSEICSELPVDLILVVHAFLDIIRDSLDTQELIRRITENENIPNVLSFAVNSSDSTRIFRTIMLASSCPSLCDAVSQTVARNNGLCQSTKSRNVFVGSNIENQLDNNFKVSTQQKNIENLDKSVQELLDRLQNGLDVKDLKSSEIMEVYDYKISALVIKTQQLQDIVDSKTALLQQADQLVSQLRCQQAQQEAEALKLRTLLKQTKFQNEKVEENLKMKMQEQVNLNDKLENANQNITRLEKQLEEQHDANAEQTLLLENTKKTLENLQVEYNAISEMNAMLQRHTESMKQKQDGLRQELQEIISEKKIMTKKLKEKENKIKEMDETIHNLEISLQQKAEEYQALLKKESSVAQKLQENLSEKLKLEEQFRLLEKHCQQHEQTITENSIQIRKLSEQLEHHKQITEMIHNLSTVPASKKDNS